MAHPCGKRTGREAELAHDVDSLVEGKNAKRNNSIRKKYADTKNQ